MADQWYYSHDEGRVGPCSSRQLRDVADVGGLLPTDTVWKEGIATGTLAKNVKNLFPSLPAQVPDIPADEAPPAPDDTTASIEATAVSPQEEPAQSVMAPANQADTAAPAYEAKHLPQVTKKTAFAILGAKIVTQDGTRVNFRKFCTKCGYDDGSRHSMLIRTGRTRAAFYCRKCRKNMPVELNGVGR
jgi:hypothetical protein